MELVFVVVDRRLRRLAKHTDLPTVHSRCYATIDLSWVACAFWQSRSTLEYLRLLGISRIG